MNTDPGFHQSETWFLVTLGHFVHKKPMLKKERTIRQPRFEGKLTTLNNHCTILSTSKIRADASVPYEKNVYIYEQKLYIKHMFSPLEGSLSFQPFFK